MKLKFKKLKMEQIWKEDKVVPVTILESQEEDKEIWKRLNEGVRVKISGKSKGKGFQGVVKRHGFSGGPRTHGQKDRLRAPGSIGSTWPQRVLPGTRMAGRMGNKKTTLKSMLIVGTVPEKKILMLKGAVPGMRGSVVKVEIS